MYFVIDLFVVDGCVFVFTYEWGHTFDSHLQWGQKNRTILRLFCTWNGFLCSSNFHMVVGSHIGCNISRSVVWWLSVRFSSKFHTKVPGLTVKSLKCSRFCSANQVSLVGGESGYLFCVFDCLFVFFLFVCLLCWIKSVWSHYLNIILLKMIPLTESDMKIP